MISHWTPSSRRSLHGHRDESEPSRVFAGTQSLGEQPESEVLSSNPLAITDTMVTSPTSISVSSVVGSGVGGDDGAEDMARRNGNTKKT